VRVHGLGHRREGRRSGASCAGRTQAASPLQAGKCPVQRRAVASVESPENANGPGGSRVVAGAGRRLGEASAAVIRGRRADRWVAGAARLGGLAPRSTRRRTGGLAGRLLSLRAGRAGRVRGGEAPARRRRLCGLLASSVSFASRSAFSLAAASLRSFSSARRAASAARASASCSAWTSPLPRGPAPA
jgi:hypothetical protein